MATDRVDAVVNLCKRRGFVFQSSEIYGGSRSAWDYGPNGVELKDNVRRQWWQAVVRGRDDVVGLDSSVILAPQVWEASGHVGAFSDPLTECKKCHRRWRADQLIVFAGLTATIEAVSEETGTPVPVLSERAVRPLAGLAEDDLKGAIREAAADGGLTPRSIGKAASSRKAKSRKASIPRPVRLRVPGGIVTIEINRAGVAAGATIETLLMAAIEAATREAA